MALVLAFGCGGALKARHRTDLSGEPSLSLGEGLEVGADAHTIQ